MADAEIQADGEDAPAKSKKGLLVGLALAVFLGGGAFYAVFSGMIMGSKPQAEHAADPALPVADLPPVAFVPIDPLVISLGKGANNQHLRFRAQLEVNPQFEQDVILLVPRVLDVLNSYLRAVDITDIENPSALISLRAQMLRRIKLVTGEGRVRDLLIMEFVLN